MNPHHSTKAAAGSPAFPPTRWSLVLDVRGAALDLREEALAKLCEVYWYPAYAFVRRSGKPSEDAKDLTQGFFLDFLGRDAFAKADPGRGRMRTFLLTALKRYLAKSHVRESAQKRGGGRVPLSIEEEEAEGRYLGEVAVDQLTPELLFERRWAQALFARAFVRLREQYQATGNGKTFDTLKPFLAKADVDSSYAEAAELLGQSAGAIGVTVFRMRKRFRSLLEEEIRHTLASDDEFDEELRHLFTVFQGK